MDKQEQLKRLHEVELEVLSEFHRICVKHNIQYFLDSGTALGAIRHGGFIPWDDDIDVGMLRSEYDRFMEVAPSEVSEGFYFQHMGVDPNYTKEHAKLRKTGTIFPEKGTESLACRGVFIDIFPFDYISDNKTCASLQYKAKRAIKGCIRNRRGGKSSRSGKLLSALIGIFPLSMYENLLERVMRLHTKPTGTVTCFLYKMCEKRDIVFPISVIYPSKNVSFEGYEFMIMNDPDTYLRIMYKDYMKLPPEDKREYHCEGEVIFND